MKTLYEFFQNIGLVTLDTLWFPMIIWTVVAFLAFLVLKVSKNLNPLYHYHLRSAVIAAIPFGLASSFLIQFLADSSTSSSSFEPVFFVVESPIAQAFNSTVSSTTFTPDWFEPHFLLGTITTVILFISLIMLFRLFWTYFNLKKLHKSLTKIELTGIQAFKNTKAKRVKLSYHDHPLVPFTFGWKQPIIVLPNSIKNDPEKVRMAVQHEMVHIQRGDYLLQLFLSSIQSVLWFHPLIWIGSKEIETYREISCDQEVLSTTGISVKNYASMLYELVPLQKGMGSFSISMAVQKSTLKQRIETMKYHKLHKNSLKRSLLFLTFMIIAVTIPIACSDMQAPQGLSFEALENQDFQIKDIIIEINGKQTVDYDGGGITAKGLKAFVISSGEYGVFMISPKKFDGASLAGEITGNQIIFNLNQLAVNINSSIEILPGISEAEAWVKHFPKQVHGFSHGAIVADGDLEEYLTKYLNPEKNEDDVFVVVEKMPQLIGGLASIQSKVNYPEMAKRAGIEGRVTVQFIVNENGDVEDPKIIRGVGGGADEEALRVIKEAKFTAGVQRGRIVRVQYTLPIIFKLSDSDF